jgi:D-alanine-D-alanine ligase
VPKSGGTIAIVRGSDAMRVSAARESANTIRNALVFAGHRVSVVDTGRGLANALRETDAGLALSCALDVRLDGVGPQDSFEVLNLAYVGSEARTTRATHDKLVTKHMLTLAGLRTPHARGISSQALVQLGYDDILPALAEDVGLPAVIKPVCGAATLGVRLVRDQAAAAAAIVSGLKYDNCVLVERWIEGSELSVLVSGDAADPRIVGVTRVFNDRLMNPRSSEYARRYEAAGDPADCPEVVSAAVSAYRALGCRDYAVVDLIVDEAGIVWILEVDAELDLSEGGRMAAAITASGRTTGDFVLDLAENAIRRGRANR